MQTLKACQSGWSSLRWFADLSVLLSVYCGPSNLSWPLPLMIQTSGLLVEEQELLQGQHAGKDSNFT